MNPRQLATLAPVAAPAPPQAAPAPAASHEPLRLQRKAGSCSCGGSCPRCSGPLDSEEGRVQRQLRIGASDDALEREADRVAAAVTAASGSDRVSPAAQTIQRLPAGGADAAGSAAPASVQQTLGRSGSALDSGVREQMEQRFGQDFGNVRVHADAQAARSAEAIDAQAYTAGANIVFAAGQYAPQSSAGQHLIAHELTHVVQQAGGAAQRVSRYRRKKGSIHHEGADELLTDSKTQPWVESFEIDFTGHAVDTGNKAAAIANGEPEPLMPTGTLTAKYSSKSSNQPANVVLNIVGGSTALGLGLTDKISKPVEVQRLEGAGYTDSASIKAGNLPVADAVSATGAGRKYAKNKSGTMNYAIFFTDTQAIHDGFLNTGSHACVHVGNSTDIRTLSHHTRIGITTVKVTYAKSVLDKLCCHRKLTGNTRWYVNPCGGIKCP